MPPALAPRLAAGDRQGARLHPLPAPYPSRRQAGQHPLRPTRLCLSGRLRHHQGPDLGDRRLEGQLTDRSRVLAGHPELRCPRGRDGPSIRRPGRPVFAGDDRSRGPDRVQLHGRTDALGHRRQPDDGRASATDRDRSRRPESALRCDSPRPGQGPGRRFETCSPMARGDPGRLSLPATPRPSVSPPRGTHFPRRAGDGPLPFLRRLDAGGQGTRGKPAPLHALPIGRRWFRCSQ